ncbi:MAG: cation-translocating P-type ATPase [Candidatus Kariarchaeaceae archaeon]
MTKKTPVISIRMIGQGWEIPLDELLDSLNVKPSRGISDAEAADRLADYGSNEIITPKPSAWKIYLAPLFDVLITIYLIMIVVMLVLSIWVKGIAKEITIWAVMISFNMILAIFQQFRAQKKIDALLKLSPPKAQVLREGETKEVLASELVPGDIIALSIGDKIPADCRIIRSSNLMVNEASLTGESVPVNKSIDGSMAIKENTPISKHKNFVYLGTYVANGNGKAVVVRTGNNTELGKIASAMLEMHSLDIPLRNRINAFGRRLALVMLSFLIVKFLIALYYQYDSQSFSFQQLTEDTARSILVAMSVMPINIPLLVTVVLISGVLEMATKKVIVKELSVVETLGRCSVLCSDKTGTITLSKMSVKLLWDTNQYYGISIDGKHRHSIHKVQDQHIDDFLANDFGESTSLAHISSGSTLELAITSSILNNDAKLKFQNNNSDVITSGYDIIGNPTDGALLVLSLTKGFDDDTIRKRYRFDRNYPFNSELKRMSSLFKDGEEHDYMVLSKGATEVILPRCTTIGDENNTRLLTEDEINNIYSKVNALAVEGYRVISLAYRSLKDIPHLFEDNGGEREFFEQDLTYIGFAVIHDPPRPGVKKAVNSLDQAGIFPIMITGDAPTTAGTIARQVGILDPDEIVIEGSKASLLSDDDFFKVSVFARVSPQDKEVIVSRYQNRGDVVAMTGDGVNDALAITKSDAGVAMGLTGTDVTKESADLILSDDSYISLVEGVREGRNLYEKIRIMIFFYIAINLAEGLLYFSASMFQDFYLINSWQRVYIFSIIHAFPVLAIIFGPIDKEIMTLKPRANDDIIPRQLFFGMLIFTFSYVLCLALIYLIGYHGLLSINSVNTSGNSIPIANADFPEYAENWDQAKARTMLISVMYLTESFMVLSIRRVNANVITSSIKDSNFIVWFFILLGPIFHFSVLYSPQFQNFLDDNGITLHFTPLAITDLLVVVIVASLPLLALELFKSHRRKENIQF